MKLVELFTEASRFESIITFFPEGRIHFSETFCQKAQITDRHKVTFHRDEQNIDDLYVSFDYAKGIPLRAQNNAQKKSSGLRCASSSTINQLRQMLNMKAETKEFKKVAFRIVAEPILCDGISVYAIITRKAVQKK